MNTSVPGPERDRDRGQPIGLEFFAEPHGDKPYLGSPDDVEAILREFAGEVHAANVAFHEGAATPESVPTRIKAAVDQRVAIFHGAVVGYRPIPNWNKPAPGGIGAGVLARQGYDETPERAVETLLNITALAVVRAFSGMLKGELTDDDAQFQTAAAIDDAVAALLGLPVTVDEP